MKDYEIIRQRNIQAKKIRTGFSKALKLNEDDYMKEFKQKAAEITERLNNTHEGEGSSAIFNLNMHQDFIVNKLGLVKRLRGHELIIKILLYKILGLKTNDEEMKRQISTIKERPSRRSILESYKRVYNKSSHSENRSALFSYLKRNQNDLQKRKPSTQQGPRFNKTLYQKPMNENPYSLTRGLVSQQQTHSNSLDLTASRKGNRDLISEEYPTKSTKDQLSPKSVVNSIIDQ